MLPAQVKISPHQKNFTRKRGWLADVLLGPVQQFLGREPRQAVPALVRRPGAAVSRRESPVPPGAVVAPLAVGVAGFGFAEVVLVTIAVTVTRGIL